eukprot:TRINITY_DN871_c0_g2_i1.p1 TRINITY_DN871_c0_g2~~TRINITY_DN871_c0_g2_i1.p1  ORF type:complete len:494 (+),score=175.21 TRINITY_DN871_c0_g2_i1:151-1632(+)
MISIFNRGNNSIQLNSSSFFSSSSLFSTRRNIQSNKSKNAKTQLKNEEDLVKMRRRRVEGPWKQIIQKMERGELKRDSNQIQLATKLDSIYQKLISSSSLIKKERNEDQKEGKRRMGMRKSGMFIYGSVGSGKTLLMRTFYEEMKEKMPSIFIHYDQFLQEIHSRLWKIRTTNENEDLDGQSMLKKVGNDLSKEFKVFCLDEFQIQDVGSAILLKQVVEEMIKCNTTFVSTSNLSIHQMCSKGLHATRIGDFESFLTKKLHDGNLDSNIDYRQLNGTKEKGKTEEIFYYSNSNQNRKKLEEKFEELSQYHMIKEESFIYLPSTAKLAIPKLGTLKDGRTIVFFEFDQICNDNFGPQDYITLAQNFDGLFLLDIPKFTNQNADQARRFITLVDQLYVQQTKLCCTMETSIDSLFQMESVTEEEFDHTLELAEDQLDRKVKQVKDTNVWHADNVKEGLSLAGLFKGGKAEEFAAGRTKSRLIEMSSRAYWNNFGK